MTEAVRLVIWDLDETFWKGTLTEGGCTFVPENRELVIELARRGIISSICSKNDFVTVQKLLIENGVWEYFVLPSISWTAKGPRIQSLIDTIGLRPSTAMFIDDNSLNLEEVRQFVPGIQTEGIDVIPQMLNLPKFRGKDDHGMSRLRQYKVLEKRKTDENAAGPNLIQFLKESNIRVTFEFDVESNLDRFIELINRTNQLNFTKTRLSDDLEIAREEATQLLRSYNLQAALVHVQDKYGDHGFCGVYVHDSEARKLRHFAFSCRVLGMGVERWLHQKLGRPHIAVSGEVLANLFDPAEVDWINLDSGDGSKRNHGQISSSFGSEYPITARGGCDLGAVIHYFKATNPDVVGEYHVFRAGGTFRTDHTAFLCSALRGIEPDQMSAARRLGYTDIDFSTRLFESFDKRHLILLSFPADFLYALYRHKNTGLEVPFSVLLPGRMHTDLRHIADAELPGTVPWLKNALEYLRDEFDFVGLIGEAQFKKNLRQIFKGIRGEARIFILNFLENMLNPDGTKGPPLARAVEMNRWIREVCEDMPAAQILDISKMVVAPREAIDHFHFDRKVYFRIYEHVRDGSSVFPAPSGDPGKIMDPDFEQMDATSAAVGT